MAIITLSMVAKINAFTLSKKSSVNYWKKTAPSPTRKPNGPATPNTKIKSREHSSIPTLPGTATYLKDALIL